MKRNLFVLLQGLGGVLLLFLVASWVLAHVFIRPRPCSVGQPPGDFPGRLESVSFGTSDSITIRGWYVAGATPASPTVILLHGYTDNRTKMLGRARMLRDAGYGALLYDARGCGESDGERISMGYYETADLIAAIGYLHSRGSAPIGVIGVSQGGATIALASGRLGGVGCAILESTYDDMRHAIDRRLRHYAGIPGWIGASMLIPIAESSLGCRVGMISPVCRIGKLGCPLLIISGESDTRVPPEDTRRLYDAASEPKRLWLVPAADHEDLQRAAPAEYQRRVLGFLRSNLPSP